MTFRHTLPDDLTLGAADAAGVSASEQRRQRREAAEILRRLEEQPGVILADEVGMGKTYVALAVAIAVGREAQPGPVIVMAPGKLVDKWTRELRSFFELYVRDARAVQVGGDLAPSRAHTQDLRFGVARNAIELLRLLDDPPSVRSQIIVLAASAMQKQQTDPWIRLYLIAEALRQHRRRRGLAGVRDVAPRFLGRILQVQGMVDSHEEGDRILAELLATSPETWHERFNAGVTNPAHRWQDDPIPKALIRVLPKLDDGVSAVADALQVMPRRESSNSRERIKEMRSRIAIAEDGVWREALSKMQWRSPLLVLDEAHHLKNPSTNLASAFREFEEGLGEQRRGAFAKRFDRMLFLTATPFQLGHSELARVLERFGDVRRTPGDPATETPMKERLQVVEDALNAAQRAGLAFHQAWKRLEPEEVPTLLGSEPASSRTGAPASRVAKVVEAFERAKGARGKAETLLRPWVIRHNKGKFWADGATLRRTRVAGGRIHDREATGGLAISSSETLPFFLAARTAAEVSKDLLGEALASSYDAFRHTRERRRPAFDRDAERDEERFDGLSDWYLGQFDRALKGREGMAHPKIAATVREVVALWRRGEKVLLFAFYVETCKALRRYISREIESQVYREASLRLAAAGGEGSDAALDREVERIRDRFFDSKEGPGRRALDAVLSGIIAPCEADWADDAALSDDLLDVMRRFLRVQTSLLRFFPLGRNDLAPEQSVSILLDAQDTSGLSWRDKLEKFCRFLAGDCSQVERRSFVDALLRVQTGGIRGELGADERKASSDGREVFLPNVQVVTGETDREQRDRLMQAFNTPFFPEVLVCSEVMGEGVDLHRACRYVIHHDLAWNPSTIEQRTGRIDRLGCKAEGRHPIHVYMPFIAGMTDERQYKVMTDREQWFRLVMGQEQVAKLVTEDGPLMVALPDEMVEQLTFKLGVVE